MTKALFARYRWGLKNLMDTLGTEHPRVTAVRILQQHLIENLTNAAARDDIVDRLNQLCLELTGKPFERFCEMPEAPVNMMPPQSVEAEEEQLPATYQEYVDWLHPLIEKRSLALPAVRKFVQARTIAILQSLDPNHKGQVVQYLYNTAMIAANSTVISLTQADLSNANLVEASLAGGDLSEADMSGANLVGATLLQAIMRRTRLAGANLSWAVLSGADLYEAEMGGVICTYADMRAAILQGANLVKSNFKQADLTGGKLGGVNMLGANFEGAVMTVADLSGAQLLWSNLIGARLDGVTLENARFNQHTQWPAGFDPQAQGAIKID
ncbi:MAG: pentapeptide repeat-containing protein [Anaerolineae bacterium]|nr:pentapeptide repeat-containing protein [Anaerolineae bacterium]